MRRLVFAALLAVGLFGVFGVAGGAAAPPPTFVEVSLKILVMGEGQPVKEAGTFISSLPVGRAGHLDRMLTVRNTRRKTKTTLALRMAVTPRVDEEGHLHCVVFSDVKPEGGEGVSRARDFLFSHPGAQIMELYADKDTASRVVLSTQAGFAPQGKAAGEAPLPPLLFLVRVEQWDGSRRMEVEKLQLQSLNGETVSHRYAREVPHWVEAEPGEEPDDPLAKLPLLDTTHGTPVVSAGQGFSLPAAPSAKKRKKGERSRKDGKKKEKEKAPEKKLAWVREHYHLSLAPIALSEGRLKLRARVEGQILDPLTRSPLPPINLEAEKDLLPGQPSPFYLTREGAGGPVGYVVWVVPSWKTEGEGRGDQ